MEKEAVDKRCALKTRDGGKGRKGREEEEKSGKSKENTMLSSESTCTVS